MKPLTPKQEKFAQLYVELGNASEAYRRSYDVSDSTSNEVIHVKASELLSNGNVSVRVEELQNALKTKHNITQEWIIEQHKEIIEWYKELKELARRDDLTKEQKSRVYMLKDLIKGSDYRGSLDSITKMLGLNKPEEHKIEHEVKQVTNNIKQNRD